MLLGEAYILKFMDIEPSIASRYRTQPHNILQPWPLSADAILLVKVLHYWRDEEVIDILKHAYAALLPGGKLYLFETILNRENPNGSLLDLNMLAESGGKLRFLSEWKKMFIHCHFEFVRNVIIKPWLNILILQKNDLGNK